MTEPTPEAMRAAFTLNWYETGKPRYHCEHCSEGICQTCSAHLIDRALDLPALLAKAAQHECSMGVGDGTGQLFVHGTYESIKAAQAIVTRAEQAEALAKCLREERNNAEAERDRLVATREGHARTFQTVAEERDRYKAALERIEKLALGGEA